jgi:hypothetical protein
MFLLANVYVSGSQDRLTPKGRNQSLRLFLILGQVHRVQFVLEIFETM